MAIVFTSWESCTVDGTAVTLSWDLEDMRGAPILLYCEAIRQALRQRVRIWRGDVDEVTGIDGDFASMPIRAVLDILIDQIYEFWGSYATFYEDDEGNFTAGLSGYSFNYMVATFDILCRDNSSVLYRWDGATLYNDLPVWVGDNGVYVWAEHTVVSSWDSRTSDWGYLAYYNQIVFKYGSTLGSVTGTASVDLYEIINAKTPVLAELVLCLKKAVGFINRRIVKKLRLATMDDDEDWLVFQEKSVTSNNWTAVVAVFDAGSFSGSQTVYAGDSFLLHTAREPADIKRYRSQAVIPALSNIDDDVSYSLEVFASCHCPRDYNNQNNIESLGEYINPDFDCEENYFVKIFESAGTYSDETEQTIACCADVSEDCLLPEPSYGTYFDMNKGYRTGDVIYVLNYSAALWA